MNRLAPLTALLRRELLTQLRRRRHTVMVLIVVLIAAWIVAAEWPSGRMIVWAMLPSISHGLLATIAGFLLVGAGLFVPGVAATAIVIERERRSWDLLSLTQIRPLSVIMGKLCSAVSLYLLFVVALFPMFATVFFLIGLDWVQLLLSLFLVLITGITCAAAGIASSSICRRSGPAIALSYAAMTAIMGLPTVILLALIAAFSRTILQTNLPYAQFILEACSPFGVLANLALGRWSGAGGQWDTFFAHIGFQAVVASASVGLAWAALRKPMKEALVPYGEGSGRVSDVGLSLRQRLRLRRLRRRRLRPPIPDGRNPVVVREFWWGMVGARRMYILAGALMIGMSLALRYAASIPSMGMGVQDAAMVSLVLHGAVVCTFVPGVLAGIFTREIESGSLDMLRMTLTRPNAIVRGKFWVGFRLAITLSLLSVLTNVGVFWGIIEDERIARQSIADRIVFLLLTGHGAILLCALVAAAFAVAASAVCRRTAAAIVTSFASVLTVLFGVPFMLAMILQMIYRLVPGPQLMEELMLVSSPVVGYVVSLEKFSGQWYTGGNRIVLDFLAWWIINVIEFLIVIAGVYFGTRTFFVRRRMRER